jgi:hypothetical protein
LPTPPPVPADLPDNTKVTIADPLSTSTATYKYTAAGGFAFVSGTGTSATSPVKLTIAGGGTANYTVTIDLPIAPQLTGYPVPITAFVDQNGNGLPDSSEPNNKTIDRVYTGYLRLLKTSRILPGTGPAVSTADATLDANPKSPAPGNIIEYQVNYTNISSPSSGTGSVILNAANVTITENGTVGGGGNNWALDNAAPAGVIDTSNVASSATDPTVGATITFFNGAGTVTTTTTGTTPTTDVTKYVDTLSTPLTPGATGTFTFQRKLN